MLDLWALRKEKVLEVLDVRAAKKARRLARQCRTLALTEASALDPRWQQAWQCACRDAVMLLGRVSSEGSSDDAVPISQRTTVKMMRVTLRPPPAGSGKYHGLQRA